MGRTLAILGTAGLAREVLLVARCVNEIEDRWDEFEFVGPAEPELTGVARYVGTDEEFLRHDVTRDIAIGIGQPAVRARVLKAYIASGGRFSFPTLVHPRAVIDVERDNVRFGRGNVVCAGVSFTCDISVGDFNYFNLNCTIGHDAVIGSCSVVNPGVNLSGGVKIGNRVLVGTGAQVLENLSVADDVTVGAGAVVHRAVEAGLTVVGVPARPLAR